MGENSEFIISGPKKGYSIWYESLGKYLFDCLQKRKSSEIIAVNAFTKETLTCGELLEKSIKLSIALKQLSVKKKDVIALITENSLLNYVVTCASLYNGSQLNLLNFAYTIDELRHVFEISQPKIIFCSKTALHTVMAAKKIFPCIQTVILMEPDEGVELQNVDELIKGIKSVDDFVCEMVDITDTAILCLSSGTTGLPKCVEISHANFIPLVNEASDEQTFWVNDRDCAVLVIPFFHIYGLDIHLLAITHSMKVISMRAFKPDLFLQAIDEYEVTKLFIAPPILQFLINSPMVSKYNLTSVKDIVLGAAAPKSEIYKTALHKFNYCAIRQIYGSTETRAISSQNQTDKFVTAGKLLYNTSAKIVSINTHTVLGPYQEGEICVKSLSVMKGYLKNSSATENAIDQDGFYHTGDIGYYDYDKNLFVVDRLKEVIKYKGFQVPPVEVENVLLTHHGVTDCGVIGVPDDRCGQLPLAFVVRREGCNVTPEELIAFVAGRISIQKQLHGGVRFIDEIPRLSSGKILRRELVKLVSQN